MRKLLTHGGVLLASSAAVSKVLGLWRDRLLIEIFGGGAAIDLVFASFRIPDFFFYLLIGGTVSTLLIPRMAGLDGDEKDQFFSSFLWGVLVLFGVLCGLGAVWAPQLIPLFAAGFDQTLQLEMLPLVRLLFGSVFVLAVSSVFGAFLQSQHRFASIALAPILYTGGICAVLFCYRDSWGLGTVGLAALSGAVMHLLINAFSVFATGRQVQFVWKKPAAAWHGFKSDFSHRVFTNVAFQINQSVDVLIASFLAAGAVGAFSIGSNAGFFLLSVLGLPTAKAVFPKLADQKNDPEAQYRTLFSAMKWILLLSIPAAVIGVVWAEPLLRFVFTLEGEALRMTTIVFTWSVASLPATCLIPTLARLLIANDQIKLTTYISATALLVATGVAAVLALWILPDETAILGLAIGNFTASALSVVLFGLVIGHDCCSKTFVKTENKKQ